MGLLLEMIEIIYNLLIGLSRVTFNLFFGSWRRCILTLILVGIVTFVVYQYRNNHKNDYKNKESVLIKWFESLSQESRKKNESKVKELIRVIKAVGSIISLFFLDVGIHFMNLFPFWNRQRKRFKKEVKPRLRFKTWRSLLGMMGLFGLLSLMFSAYLTSIVRECLRIILSYVKNQNVYFDWKSLYLTNLFNFKILLEIPTIAIPLALLLFFLAIKSAKINWEHYRNYNNNEHGDDRFATVRELKHQYVMIPDRKERYKGKSGIPIVHLTAFNIQGLTLSSRMVYSSNRLNKIMTNLEKNALLSQYKAGYYLVDQQTINVLIVGGTRTGKGESMVNPTIDIISRAKDQSSMIIGDPKGELSQASYETLRKRNYNVQILSFQDMDFSVSYNPLALAISAAKHGYYEKVQARVNKVAEAIYRTPKKNGVGTGNQKYWEDTSISLFNAIAIALIDRAAEAIKVGEKDAWETVTIRNVATFLTDLGSEFVFVDENNEVTSPDNEAAMRKTKLTHYFDTLRQINQLRYSKFREMADINFRSSDFASEETKGNIYSSMLSGINLFLQDNIARLTSKNNLNLLDFGNPRRLTIQFRTSANVALPNPYAFQTATINIFEDKAQRLGIKRTGKQLIKNAKATIDEAGYLTYVISPELPERTRIEVTFDSPNNEAEIFDHKYIFKATKEYERKQGRIVIDRYTRDKILLGMKIEVVQKPKATIFDKQSIEFVYSEKPLALFLVTPPNRNEYGFLFTLLIDQIFNANYEVALNGGRSNIRRIQFLFDEFANIPAVPNLSQKLSIALGQNFQFMLIVQNLEQLIEKYGQEETANVIGNSSLFSLIKTNSLDTNEKFSKMLGNKTIDTRKLAQAVLNEANPNVDQSTEKQELLTVTQLAKLQAGEVVTIRTVKARDLKGHKVTPDPVFAHGRTEMPFRYMFLDDEFDQSKTAADIGYKSLHRGLNLKALSINPLVTAAALDEWVKAVKAKKDTSFPTRYYKLAKKEETKKTIADQKEEVLADEFNTGLDSP